MTWSISNGEVGKRVRFDQAAIVELVETQKPMPKPLAYHIVQQQKACDSLIMAFGPTLTIYGPMSRASDGGKRGRMMIPKATLNVLYDSRQLETVRPSQSVTVGR